MDITELSQAVIGAVRTGGPVAAGAGAVMLAVSASTATGRARLRLAAVGLAGSARSRPVGRVLVAAIVPALAIAVLCVSLSLEREVRLGPNRVIDQLAAPAQRAGGVAWVFQDGTDHFMDDSRLVQARDLAAAPPAGVVPLWAQLTTIRTSTKVRSGLVFAPRDLNGQPFSPEVDRRDVRCRLTHERCNLAADQVVTDASLAPIGARVVIRGSSLVVAAHTRTPISLLNRAVVFANPSLFVDGDQTASPYGLIVAGPRAVPRARVLVAGLGSGQVEDQQQLLDANSQFWAGNGTPLLLLVISMSTLFAGTSMYAARRASQEQARVPIGTLRALGLTAGRAAVVDLARASMIAAVAATLAWPISIGLVAAANSAILGFHASVSVPIVAASLGVIIASDVLGTLVLWRRLRRASVVEAISGT